MRCSLHILFSLLFIGANVYAAETKAVEARKEIRKKIKKPSPSHFWLDLGFGLPQLTSVELGYRLFPRWQIGVSYGLIPFGPTFKLPSQNVTLKNKEFVTVDQPTVKASLSSLCPFARFFPKDSNFYFQMTMAMMTVKNTFSSGLTDVYGNSITNGSYGGTISVTQYLPTIAIGHAFASKLFFFNVSMGISFIANVNVSVEATGQIPDSLGGTAANQDMFDKLDSSTTTAANQGVDQLRAEMPVIPSIQMTWGIMF